MRLLQHQHAGVEWLVKRERALDYPGGFLCDEMGLGKTVQLIATMMRNPLDRTLIIVPKSIVTQWASEIERFAPEMKVHTFDGPKRVPSREAQVTIAPYSVLPQRKGAPECPLLSMYWNRVILDEGHEIRNPKSKTHKTCAALQADVRWVVSGTPVFNSIKDFVALGAFLGMPKLHVQCYTEEVCKKYLLRRTKADCQRFTLPPCEIESVELDMNEKESELYFQVYTRSQQTVSDIFASGGENKHQMELIEALLRVRQVMAWPQLYTDGMARKEGTDPEEWTHSSTKMDWLVESVKSHRSEKTLIFAQFVGEMDEIHLRMKDAGFRVYRIDGSVDTERRAGRIERFKKTDKPAVFLIQIKAGGVGLNLAEASRVYITTPAWNPATELQAIARAHRNGQLNKVIVKKLIYKGTEKLPSIEQSIMDLQGHKSAVCAEVLQDDRLRSQLPTAPKNGVTVRAVRKIFAV
jgi:SNF2 family DNA or RNA helicase